MKRVLIVALFLLLSSSGLWAAEYGTYDLKKTYSTRDGDAGRKRIVVDLRYLDGIIDDLSSHAADYPPRFESDTERLRAAHDAKQLARVLDILSRGRNADRRILLRAAVVCSLAHNLDVPDAAAKADRLFRDLLVRYPGDAEVHFRYGMFLAGTGHADDGLAHLERALAGGVKAADYPLGMVYLSKGDKDHALRHLKAYRKTDPGDASVESLIRAVESGAVTVREKPVSSLAPSHSLPGKDGLVCAAGAGLPAETK